MCVSGHGLYCDPGRGGVLAYGHTRPVCYVDMFPLGLGIMVHTVSMVAQGLITKASPSKTFMVAERFGYKS